MSRRSYAVERAALRVPLQDLRWHIRTAPLDGGVSPARVVPGGPWQRRSTAVGVRQRRCVERGVDRLGLVSTRAEGQQWMRIGLRLPLTSPVDNPWQFAPRGVECHPWSSLSSPCLLQPQHPSPSRRPAYPSPYPLW